MYRTRRIVASIRRSGWQGKRLQARPARTLDQQVALLGASMQSEALSIAPPIDVASPIAATAITLPITARIKAYSAADAPDSSFHRFFKKLFRSEEHTSELQSLMRSSYAVFCLKKKTKT